MATPTVSRRTLAMTVTAAADQLVDEVPADNTTERLERADPLGSVEQLAVLRAQSYVSMPLFA
jgi:hypothetical protein